MDICVTVQEIFHYRHQKPQKAITEFLNLTQSQRNISESDPKTSKSQASKSRDIWSKIKND